jgi:hypothetical protein
VSLAAEADVPLRDDDRGGTTAEAASTVDGGTAGRGRGGAAAVDAAAATPSAPLSLEADVNAGIAAADLRPILKLANRWPSADAADDAADAADAAAEVAAALAATAASATVGFVGFTGAAGSTWSGVTTKCSMSALPGGNICGGDWDTARQRLTVSRRNAQQHSDASHSLTATPTNRTRWRARCW